MNKDLIAQQVRLKYKPRPRPMAKAKAQALLAKYGQTYQPGQTSK
jgi:hypothetical protein